MRKRVTVTLLLLLAAAAFPEMSLAAGRNWKAAGKLSTVITGVQTAVFLPDPCSYESHSHGKYT